MNVTLRFLVRTACAVLLLGTTTRSFARRSIVASFLLLTALFPAQAAPKTVGTKVNMQPSINGGAPLTVQLYNFTSGPATCFYVDSTGVLQSLPGAATIPPTGTTPVVVNSFRLATIYLQREGGGGMWKHLGGNNPTPLLILGTPPPGFKEGLKNQATPEPGGEIPDDDGPDGKRKKVVNKKTVNNTTTTVMPPAPPAEEPAAADADKAKRKGPRGAKDPQVVEFLRIHNAARKDVGVSPLEWSDDLARDAQEWADQLAKTGQLQQQPDSKYGQNIDMGSGDFAPATAANAWLAEKASYNPAASPPKGAGKKAAKRNEELAKSAHYTQMVWGKSITVGYGIAQTADGKTVVVANYNPPGNVVGEKPYAQ